MSLPPSSPRTRPYFGRAPDFDAAVKRAERAALPPEPEAPMFVGRSRSGSVRDRYGNYITPGPLFDVEQFNALPLID